MQTQHITIRFYEELNDFLPKENRKKEFEYGFSGNPSIKDAIEAMGVPHPEVDLILVNGISVNFDYNIQPGDRISVYPAFELLDISPVSRLRPKPLRVTKFILDINLGKLAVKLRMLGLDTLYENNFTNLDIIQTAEKESRIILTRDHGLLKNKKVTHGYWIRNNDPKKQLREIIEKFDLSGQINPFTICMVCNGKIRRVEKNIIIDGLLPKVKKNFEEFYQCSNCKKVYWKGTHFIKMQAEIGSIINDSKK